MALDSPLHQNILTNLLYHPDLDAMQAHSYRDFHAKGLDYICLHRSKDLTVKAYILRHSRGLARLQNLVNPHDHAYNFDTFVLDGQLQNVCFREDHLWTLGGEKWYEFNYRTPLNGQPRTTLKREIHLYEDEKLTRIYNPGEHYYMEHWQIHTIRAITRNVTMLLFQYRDVTRQEGTRLFLQDLVPPETVGLYSRYCTDDLNRDLGVIRAAIT